MVGLEHGLGLNYVVLVVLKLELLFTGIGTAIGGVVGGLFGGIGGAFGGKAIGHGIANHYVQ